MSSSRTRRAALQLVGSSVLFAVMAMATKQAARRLPGPQAAMIRFGAGLLAAAVGTMAGHVAIRPQRWGWLLLRGLFGGIAVLTYFMCIERVPVGVATLLNQTQPIYTMLFAWLLLRERPPRAAVVALPLSTIGVALIVGVRVSALHAGWGETLGIISAVTSGVAVTAIRAARRDEPGGPPPDSAWTVFFSFTALGFLVTAPAVLPPLGTWVRPTAAEWRWLAVVGVAGVSAQLIMTDALRHIGGASAGIIAQLVVLLTIAGGALVFGDRITVSLLVGGALTLTGVVLAIAGSSAQPSALAESRAPDL